MAENAYGKLLQKGYSATIHLPPCVYNKITKKILNKHKKKMEFEETMKFETKLQSTYYKLKNTWDFNRPIIDSHLKAKCAS